MPRNDTNLDLSRLSNTELVEHVARRHKVTPLENEMRERLEQYIAVYEDMFVGG